MSAVPYVNGIAEITGREPVGICMSIGRKGSKGAPVDTDRFYIVVPQEVDGVRALHPSFHAFNTAEPERRTVMRCNIVHSAVEDCFQHSLKAQVVPGIPAHPAKAPACMGDGHRAKRWLDGEYKDIPCPAALCPYRQQDGNKPAPCRPFGRLLFRPRWAEGSTLPSMLCKWTTTSWNSVGSVLGLFNHVRDQAQQLGVKGFSLYGLPIVLTLGRKKRSGESGGRSFPIVSASVDGDIIDFLLAQQKRLAELGGHAPPLVAITDREQQSVIEVAADARQVAGPINIDIPQEPEE